MKNQNHHIKITKATVGIVCAALVLQALLAGCGATATTAEAQSEASAESGMVTQGGTSASLTETAVNTNTTDLEATYTDRDLAGDWDAAAAAAITCNGTEVAIVGSGATVKDGVITITAEGVYVISGSLTGQIVVAAGENEKVQLVLNGVSITAPEGTGPAINAQTADKVFVTLAEGTENTLTDSATYTLPDGSDEPNACLYADCDLTINGNGALTVVGRYHHGIFTKDDLRITGGSITVTAAADGVKGRDSVSVCGGTLDITATDDGLCASNDTDADKGWICIDGGSFTISSGCDGIQAETVLQINEGIISVTAGGGAANAKALAADGSAKGLKAGNGILINGGNVTADCADDTLHTNGNATVTAGSLTLASGDDGMHADSALLISGGTVTVTQSYEGLEGETVDITGGEISVKADDDGINCAGGSDGDTLGATAPNTAATDTFVGRGGGGGGMGNDANAVLTISGGTLFVDADGDGLDSNGTMTVTGGIVLVSGPTNSGNGALDTGTSATVNGGYVIAVGNAGMAINFDSGTQGSWLADTGTQAAGTSLTLTDAAGNVLMSWTPDKEYACAVLSCAGLTEGETYTLTCGGTVTGADDSENGFARGGTLSGGTIVATKTLDALQSSDVTGMGGRGGFGGMTGEKTLADGEMPQGGRGGMGGTRPTDGTAGATPTAPEDGETPNGTPPALPADGAATA